MDSGADVVMSLAARLSRLAALSLGFAVGSVRINDRGTTLVRQSGRVVAEDLSLVAERLDDQVLSSGLPLTAADLSALAGEVPETQGSYVGVPICADGRVVGVISLTDTVAREVSDEHLRVLVDFAQLLAEQFIADQLLLLTNPAGRRRSL